MRIYRRQPVLVFNYTLLIAILSIVILVNTIAEPSLLLAHLDSTSTKQHNQKTLKQSEAWGIIKGVEAIDRRSQHYFHRLPFNVPRDISLGDPKQPFRAVVDTAWTDLFVPSATNEEPRYFRDHCLYNSSRSSTYVGSHTKASIHWNGLYTSGNVSQDTLHIADLRVEYQKFEEASKFRPVVFFWDYIFDAVLGLARLPIHSKESTLRAPGPYQNMVEQMLLHRNVIGLRLPMTDAEHGELSFGSINTDLFSGELIPLSIDESTHHSAALDGTSFSGWQVAIGAISLTSDSQEFVAPLPMHTAVFQSAYPWIDVPSQVAQDLVRLSGADDSNYVDCNRKRHMPNLTITLGPESKDFTLVPDDYVLDFVAPWSGTRVCMVPFNERDEESEVAKHVILGTSF